jgi:hypothetical protein
MEHRHILPAPRRSTEFWPQRLTIRDARDWIVHDVCKNGRSILAEAGDIPGEMFGDRFPLCVGSLGPSDEFTVTASHVGESSQTRLSYELSGNSRPPASTRGPSMILPMSTGVRILPNMSAQITGRICNIPSGCAMLPERVVLRDPRDWVVSDLRVGNCSEFVQCGDVPGVAFASQAVGNRLLLDPLRQGVDLAMVVTYVGPCESGAELYAGVDGQIVRLVD